LGRLTNVWARAHVVNEAPTRGPWTARRWEAVGFLHGICIVRVVRVVREEVADVDAVVTRADKRSPPPRTRDPSDMSAAVVAAVAVRESASSGWAQHRAPNDDGISVQ